MKSSASLHYRIYAKKPAISSGRRHLQVHCGIRNLGRGCGHVLSGESSRRQALPAAVQACAAGLLSHGAQCMKAQRQAPLLIAIHT